MRPPVCEICDADIDPTDGSGGLVTFQPDDRSIAWRRRAEDEVGFVGHPPDTGWFCGAHIEAAREVARTRSLAEGLRQVEAHTRHIDVHTLDFGDPIDLPQAIAVPLRSSDGLLRVLRHHRAALVVALGGGDVTTRSSSGFRLDGDHNRSVDHATAGPYDLIDRIDYLRVEGELVAQLVESRVARNGELLALVRSGPFDQLHAWVGDERLRGWADLLVSDLALAPPDLLDPSPDLVEVDLGAGRLMASDAFEQRWVQWDVAGVDVHALARSFRSALPALFAALGLGEPPSLEARTDRDWSPMDGSQPPYCPFTDTTIEAGGGGDGPPVAIRIVLDHWNDTDVNSASVSLSIDGHVSISAFGPNGGGRSVRTLWLHRPTTAAVVDVVDQLISSTR